MEEKMNWSYAFKKLPENISPIFITGAPRSGTTLVAVHLNRHPEIAVSPETHFFVKHYTSIKELKKKILPSKARELVLKGYGIKDLKIDGKLFEKLFKNSEQRAIDAFDIVMYLYRSKAGKRRWCEKTPGHILYVNNILNIYPSAKIIHVVRDPRAVINSARKVPWGTKKLIPNIYIWLRCNKRIKDCYKDQVINIKYESFVKNPTKELKKILTFLNEDFYEDILVSNNDCSIIPEWELKWKAKAYEPPCYNRVTAWRYELKDEEIKFIEFLLRRNMKFYEYNYNEIKFNISIFKIFKEEIMSIFKNRIKRAAMIISNRRQSSP